ncbi:hypothetical protein AMAG_17992 [Allomyces macrogynus ATCC 38327]|uniref:Uncharacterized protein n=1 Tax=Allomyces macrogynus (strain ATCC 38327) TaxID=578462 RepID=A0A0L0S393_ALLM3|nr:hypothetical protein AMAG_17992 [Allomyces macrogynus ATCC 38327]|eukprot:KNE56998.1 hypothetical protein AMAG_17992 [Allomyces macrogynus ATCC 38327]
MAIADGTGVVRPPIYPVLARSIKDGIRPGMAIPRPVKAIRHMKVVSSSWFFDRAVVVPARDTRLEGVHLNAERCRLLMVHLPPTLRGFGLDAVFPRPSDLDMIIREFPRSLQELYFVAMNLNYHLNLLARSFPPAPQSLWLVNTDLTHRGLVAVIAAVPVHQLESLDLSINVNGLEMFAALAVWLAQSTRLHHLVLGDLDCEELTSTDAVPLPWSWMRSRRRCGRCTTTTPSALLSHLSPRSIASRPWRSSTWATNAASAHVLTCFSQSCP